MYTHTHKIIHTCIHINYIYTYMYVCIVHTYMYVSIYAYVCTNVCIFCMYAHRLCFYSR